jgi:ceramide glucosyltransferase
LEFTPFPLAGGLSFRLGTGVVLNWILSLLALLSLVLLLWQWWVARRFPLHQRSAGLQSGPAFAPAVSLLKPLKGCDATTEECLRSWLVQEYAAPVQVLFAVASADDPVCEIVRKLLREQPKCDAQLVVCSTMLGPNAKVSKLAELEKLAKYDVLVASDADVRVPPDLLANAVVPLREPNVGLVNCFYRLANPATLAMQWEAVAINADFWSQVLQSRSLKPLDFALGAVMITRRKNLEGIGGFKALVNCLADDYQLGHRIAGKGHRIELCSVVVECWNEPMTWGEVWKHQLRWARTIRACQPVPYFFSVLSNVTLWALLCLLIFLPGFALARSGVEPVVVTVHLTPGFVVFVVCVFVRTLLAFDLQRRLTRSTAHFKYLWLAPVKDLLQAAIWLCAFAGNRVEWRGRTFKLRHDGTLADV